MPKGAAWALPAAASAGPPHLTRQRDERGGLRAKGRHDCAVTENTQHEIEAGRGGIRHLAGARMGPGAGWRPPQRRRKPREPGHEAASGRAGAVTLWPSTVKLIPLKNGRNAGLRKDSVKTCLLKSRQENNPEGVCGRTLPKRHEKTRPTTDARLCGEQVR